MSWAQYEAAVKVKEWKARLLHPKKKNPKPHGKIHHHKRRPCIMYGYNTCKG